MEGTRETRGNYGIDSPILKAACSFKIEGLNSNSGQINKDFVGPDFRCLYLDSFAIVRFVEQGFSEPTQLAPRRKLRFHRKCHQHPHPIFLISLLLCFLTSLLPLPSSLPLLPSYPLLPLLHPLRPPSPHISICLIPPHRALQRRCHRPRLKTQFPPRP